MKKVTYASPRPLTIEEKISKVKNLSAWEKEYEIEKWNDEIKGKHLDFVNQYYIEQGAKHVQRKKWQLEKLEKEVADYWDEEDPELFEILEIKITDEKLNEIRKLENFYILNDNSSYYVIENIAQLNNNEYLREGKIVHFVDLDGKYLNKMVCMNVNNKIVLISCYFGIPKPFYDYLLGFGITKNEVDKLYFVPEKIKM